MNFDKIEKEELIEYLENGLSTRDIGKKLKLNHRKVLYWINKYNLKSKMKYRNPIYTDEQYFKKINTKQKAYILGFLLGDGYLNHNNLSCNIKYDDRSILHFISKELGCTVKYDLTLDKSKKRFPSAKISIGNPKIIKDIKKLFGTGLKPTRRIPIISKWLEPYLISGFFDAEGCITWGKRKDRDRLWQKISFTSSLNLLVGIQNILNNYGISTIIKPKKNENCYLIEFSNELDIYNFWKILPKDLFCLKRKRLHFVEWLVETQNKYKIKLYDEVKFVDKRTLQKYNSEYLNFYKKGTFKVCQVKHRKVLLNDNEWYPTIILSKKGISNYALRLELDKFGERFDNPIPSQAESTLSEGVETSGEVKSS